MAKARRFTALILVCLLLFSACAKTDSAPVEDGAIEDTAVVASIGERHVTWAQYRMTFETYLQYYQEMGFDVFATEDRLSGFQERTVETLLETCVIAHQAELAGCNELTTEEQAELDAQIAAEIDALDDVYLEQVAAEKEANDSLDEEARLRELIAAESYYYTGVQMDYDSYIEWITNYYCEQYYAKKLREKVIADVAVTDETVRAYYDETLTSDQNALLNDPSAYAQAAEQATEIPVLFAPDNYSQIMILSFAAEDISSDEAYTKITSQLATLTTDYGEAAIDAELNGTDHTSELEALLEQYRILLAEKQALLDAATEDAYAKAEATLAEVKNEGGLALREGVRMRYISPGYPGTWSAEIIDAFEKLEVGEFSDVIRDADGCHIIYYAADVTPGPVAFEDVETAIHNKLLAEAQEAAWQAQLDLYMADEEIVRNTDLIHAMGTK